MGGRRPTLPHTQLVILLREENAADSKTLIAKLQQEEPAYQALFELVALCKTLGYSSKHAATQEYPQSFLELEELLSRLYSGAASAEDGARIMNGLIASPVFYQRLLAKLETMAPQLVWEETEALADIAMKSDAEIMAIVKRVAQAPTATRQARPSPVRLLLDNFVEGVHKIRPREPAGISIGQIVSTFVAGTIQAIAQLLDYVAGNRATALAVPLVLFATIFLFNEKLQQNFYEAFVWDEEVPCAYVSGTRGSPSTAPPSTALAAFQHEFGIAMSDYMLRRYRNVQTTLQKIAPVLSDLQKELPEKEYAALLSEYLFYGGVSQLALARSKLAELSDSQRMQHLEQAAALLSRADSLAQKHQMQNAEREAYFLGIAYGFSGKHQEAVEQLRRVPSTSAYYSHSIKLIARWTP